MEEYSCTEILFNTTLYIQENLDQLSVKQSAQIIGIMNITEQISM